MVKIKQKVSKFFAKTDLVVSDCNKEVAEIGQMINSWSKNQKLPV